MQEEVTEKKVDISISVELSYVPHSLMTIVYESPPQRPGHSDESKFWNCQCSPVEMSVLQ